MEGVAAFSIDWGVAHRPLEATGESGDACVFAPFPNGCLVAVLDGVGHGAEAAAAVRIAAGVLRSNPHEPPMRLLLRCDAALRATRGAALSIASFDTSDATMTWLGVGNVEAVLHRAHRGAWPRSVALLLRGGVVGHRLPPLACAVLPVSVGDTLILATDGVDPGFTTTLPAGEPPLLAAERILSRHGKKTDDALVVVARCKEPQP